MSRDDPNRLPMQHVYGRISNPKQRAGVGMERQETADFDRFGKEYGFATNPAFMADDGVSAFRGVHLTPEHELGQFLLKVRQDLVPAGDCLLIENWDRLSRQDVWAATALVSELREFGIHVGRMDTFRLLRCDSVDPGDFFECALSLMRAHDESRVKSMRVSDAWERKRQRARESGKPMGGRIPAWIRKVDGRMEVIPERAEVILKIVEWAIAGAGINVILTRLVQGGYPPFRDASLKRQEKPRPHKPGARRRVEPGERWSKSYLGALLRDRRLVGAFQPRRRDGEPAGPELPGYYPAVIDEPTWNRLRANIVSRSNLAGRVGKRVNLWSHILKDARSGDTYRAHGRRTTGACRSLLAVSGGVEGKGSAWTFPMRVFDQCVLERLSEVKPADVLAGNPNLDELTALEGERRGLLASLESTAADYQKHRSVRLAEIMAADESALAEINRKLALAKQRAACPTKEAWGEFGGLVAAEEQAADKVDFRLRLRALLRRMLAEVRLLVVPIGITRLAMVQVFFVDGVRRRTYLIHYRPEHATPSARIPGVVECFDFPGPAEIDLRKPQDVQDAIEALEGWKDAD